MRTRIFQLDAFTTRRFAGNPAAVMVMDRFPADSVMQQVAAENNLAETAFLIPENVAEANGDYRLRWFTPLVEVPLCGHATLASAAVVMERLQPERKSVTFHSISGPLEVSRTGDGYAMNFPARPAETISTPAALAAALGVEPVEVVLNTFNYLALLKNAATVRNLAPDMAAIAALDRPGVIVTAADETGEYDFISRYFAPKKGIAEDPVTGAAHCMLAPFWVKRLNKIEFRGYQASRRGGEVRCKLMGDRVELRGACVFYLEGEAEI